MPDTEATQTSEETTETTRDGQTGAATQTPAAGSDSQDGANDVTKLAALVDKLRPFEHDAKRLQRELAAAQAKLKEREDADKTDAERALARAEAAERALTDTQTRMRQQSVRHAVASAARDAGFINPDDAHRFVDLATIQFDDEGEPQGVADAVKAIAKERPYLLGSTSNGKSGPPATEKTSRQAGESTPEEERARAASFAAHLQRNF